MQDKAEGHTQTESKSTSYTKSWFGLHGAAKWVFDFKLPCCYLFYSNRKHVSWTFGSNESWGLKFKNWRGSFIAFLYIATILSVHYNTTKVVTTTHLLFKCFYFWRGAVVSEEIWLKGKMAPKNEELKWLVSDDELRYLTRVEVLTRYNKLFIVCE